MKRSSLFVSVLAALLVFSTSPSYAAPLGEKYGDHYIIAVNEHAAGPGSGSAFYYRGVSGNAGIESPFVNTSSSRPYGHHVSGLYMYGYASYAPQNKPDMAEVGWVKDPYAGWGTPTVMAAWRWQNYPYYGYVVYTNLKPSLGSTPWFCVEWLSDGAWHGYYGSTHILAVGNRNNTATPVASSERYYAGYTDSYGMYQPGDDDYFETAWLGLNRMDVFGNWAKFSQIGPAYYPSIGWTLLWTDPEFDAFTGFSYDSSNDGYDWTPRVSFYKARNSGGGGWVKHAGVAYAERWWNGRNTSKFGDYSPNDCANFVSQCLNAGTGYPGGYPGIPQNSGWYSYWSGGAILSSLSWVNANEQYNHMAATPRFYFYPLGPSGSVLYYDWMSDTGAPEPPDNNPKLNNGDIVSWDQEFKEVLDHAAFVVGQYQYDKYKSSIGYSGYYFGDVVDAHTNDRWHMVWHAKPQLFSQGYYYARVYPWGLKSSAN